ncbi:hypothetical protein DACRYDRAFT_108977 [Dacryopinax primogenitus]|uniref:Uncharacterized protein n=1 Tax=Dacryopinax primogenitus (strain DJM 731) TaxID=1858805 RepID=M5FX05_DACPD|nr:uncharacterized protein DACRYDRAFT_108977 [Dacryopinax primogenitus]EJU00230.1 hypothetical protein DACRYDRAFT_108977 [Dacryopinax primogenitus]
MAPIQLSDFVFIPAHDNAAPTVHVTWSQSWTEYTKDYKFFMAKAGNDQKDEVPLYIASEFADESHFKGVETVTVDGTEYYKMKVDGRFQYGQKGKNGEGRFLVWHDKSRKPYQHRFVNSTVQLQALGLGTKLAGYFGYGNVADLAGNALKAAFGDYLHNF